MVTRDFNFYVIKFGKKYDDGCNQETWQKHGQNKKTLCLARTDEDGDTERVFIKDDAVLHVSDLKGCVLNLNAPKDFHEDMYHVEILHQVAESDANNIDKLNQIKAEIARTLI